MSKQLLTAYELVGGYGKIDILHGVSLSVGVGEIVSVIGPNGAGESTAFKTIVGFLRPRSGRVVFSGEQQMLAIGRALMTAPRLILLDEPSLGLAPKFVTLIFDKLMEMKRAGYTLMLVEQNAARALAIADRAYALELGRNRFEGPGTALLADPEVKRLYLGG